jgi:hypothetical protein
MVVRDYLIKNSGVTASLPNYTDFFAEVVDGIVQIQDIRELQEPDKKGLAVNKLKHRDSLISLAFDVALKTVAYALYVTNDELFNEVNYTESELKKCADTILYDRCRLINERAQANAAALLPYGVSPAMLANLQILLDDYNASIPRPRLGIADRKQATEQLAVWIKQVDKALINIDVLTDVVRFSEPLFYAGYQTARTIVDSGKRKHSLTGLVIDSVTRLPLKGAQLMFTPVKESFPLDVVVHPVKKRSADKGRYFIRSMHQGSYKVEIVKPGYFQTVFTVHITEGELCRFKAPLVPQP